MFVAKTKGNTYRRLATGADQNEHVGAIPIEVKTHSSYELFNTESNRFIFSKIMKSRPNEEDAWETAPAVRFRWPRYVDEVGVTNKKKDKEIRFIVQVSKIYFINANIPIQFYCPFTDELGNG